MVADVLIAHDCDLQSRERLHGRFIRHIRLSRSEGLLAGVMKVSECVNENFQWVNEREEGEGIPFPKKLRVESP